MERLTARNESGQAFYKKCFENPCDGMGLKDCNTCEHSNAICERLAAYEDLEITPEQVKEIDRCYSELSKELGKYKKLEEQHKEAIAKAQAMELKPPKKETFVYKGICPICGNRILLVEKYCSQCGQKVEKHG